MTRTIETVTATAPSHWATYLINGDASAFSYYGDEDDEQACYDFSTKYGSCVGVEDAGFLTHPDYGTAASECSTYTFQVSAN